MWHGDHKTPPPLFRSRRGVVFGVCRGVAEYFGLSVFWTRVAAVACLLMTGVWPAVGGYLLAALLMKPAPVAPFESDEDCEFYQSYASSRRMAVHRLKHAFDRLDRRIQRMEDLVTSRDYDWDKRLRS